MCLALTALHIDQNTECLKLKPDLALFGQSSLLRSINIQRLTEICRQAPCPEFRQDPFAGKI